MTTDDQTTRRLDGALGLPGGQIAFPWQQELLKHIVREAVPQALDIPTGLGKTAVMAVWLVARASGAAIPRRLVYVVDRRAVVDQATTEAERLRSWVNDHPEVKAALGIEPDRALPISTLRGQFVDNREWLEDPSSPAIIIGTIDMVGSRLLFSGYGVSSKMRPYHAGLLGTDALVVLDEAHLVPAFEDLLRQVELGADSFGPEDPRLRKLLPPFKLLSLSATGRETDASALTLSDADRLNPVVSKRLNAKKTLATVELATVAKATDTNETGENESTEVDDDVGKKSKGPKLANVLAKEAWELTQRGSAKVRCLVFCNSRKDVTTVAAELRNLAKSASSTEPAVELLVGGRRVKERVQARDALARLGFLAGTSAIPERSAFLIATSAGEVGVDLDADHMVCDLVAWERMVQRLGRVNRRGDGDAKVIVVVESEPAPSDGMKKVLEKRDVSKAASEQLNKLTEKLNELQGEKKGVPRGQKKSADAKATEETRKQIEKELKEAISTRRKRIKAFKDTDAKVVARHDAEAAKYRALRMLLAAVGEGGSLSPNALLQLRRCQDLVSAIRDATTVEPLRPELSRGVIDAWSMTSLDEHPGRPEVDPWLRGFRPNDPPQTTVVWRTYLPVRNCRPFDAKAAKRFFEAAPPHASEKLEIETYLVLDWLIARASSPKPKPSKSVEDLLEKRASNADKLSEKQHQSLNEYDAQIQAYNARPRDQDVVVVGLTSHGEVKGWRTLKQLQVPKGDLGKKARDQLEELLIGATLLVDARLGGLTDGLLDDKVDTIAKAADAVDAEWLARPDATKVPITGFRIRQLRAAEWEDGDPTWSGAPGDGWVRRYLFVTETVDGEPFAALAIDGWGGDPATEDERAETNFPQQLEVHQNWAEEHAQAIAKRLGLAKNYEDLLALAARLHDEGKRAARWQRAFKAPIDGRPYAKTEGPIDFDILDGYRHELGSLFYIEKHDEFQKLPDEDRDFILHLVAAHHGYARPVIGTTGCDDAPPSVIDERAREVALRFARLSKRWGPWGLAWWEALLRAADQIASRRNQRDASPARKEQA